MFGHKVSKSGVEVDKARVEVFEKSPPPISIKGMRSFLGHVGFYWRFIKDFSKISRPMCNILEKEVIFDFDAMCLIAFEMLKRNLIEAHILISPDSELPFELMCDASKTLDSTKVNYMVTEKENLALMFSFDRFI